MPKGIKGHVQDRGRRLIRLMGRLGADSRGVILPLMAFALPVLIGFAALAVDVAAWYTAKQVLQTAADAGSVAGSHVLREGGDYGDVVAAATADAVRNGFDPDIGTITVHSPPASGGYAGLDGVEVILSEPQGLFFAGVIMSGDSVDITTRSVSLLTGEDGDACVLALDPDSSRAIEVTGGADVQLTGCEVFANSEDDQAIWQGGGSDFSAACAGTVGGITGTVDTTECDAPRAGQAAIDDPFGDIEPPSTPATCLKSGNYKPSDGEVLQPGRYCGGIKIANGRDVTLAPGEYLIDGGRFHVAGGSELIGEGVTLFFVNDGSARMDNGTDIRLSAPTSGPYAGFVMFQDRDIPNQANLKVVFNGGVNLTMTGVMYFPNQDVLINGGANINTDCLKVVSATVQFKGGADMRNACEGTGVEAIATSRGSVTLVE